MARRSAFRNEQTVHAVLRSDDITVWGLPPINKVEMVVGDRRILEEKILFRFDSATIAEAERQAKISTIAKDLARLLVADSNVTISVEGHTDENGGESYNKDLGLRRAMSAVRALIVEDRSLCSGRFTIVSHGDSVPLDPDSSPEAWSLNRRVEFVVVKEGVQVR